MAPSILELIGLATCFISVIAIIGGTIYAITKFVSDFNQLKDRFSYHTSNPYTHDLGDLRTRIDKLEQAFAEYKNHTHP